MTSVILNLCRTLQKIERWGLGFGFGFCSRQCGVNYNYTVLLQINFENQTHVAGETFDFFLNVGESAQIQTENVSPHTGLTGSHITSDKPIAVFSGEKCTILYTLNFITLQMRLLCCISLHLLMLTRKSSFLSTHLVLLPPYSLPLIIMLSFSGWSQKFWWMLIYGRF